MAGSPWPRRCSWWVAAELLVPRGLLPRSTTGQGPSVSLEGFIRGSGFCCTEFSFTLLQSAEASLQKRTPGVFFAKFSQSSQQAAAFCRWPEDTSLCAESCSRYQKREGRTKSLPEKGREPLCQHFEIQLYKPPGGLAACVGDGDPRPRGALRGSGPGPCGMPRRGQGGAGPPRLAPCSRSRACCLRARGWGCWGGQVLLVAPELSRFSCTQLFLIG